MSRMLLRLASLAVAASATAFAAPTLASLQASVLNANAPSNVTSITTGTQVNGFWLYINSSNGSFAPAAPMTVNWVDTTNNITTTLTIQGAPTTTRVIALVTSDLYLNRNPSTVQISVANNGLSNALPFFIVSPATTAPSLPSATVGSAYGPVTALVNGTPPFAFSVGSGSLPPGISLSTAGQLSANTVTSPPGLYTESGKATDFWGASTAHTFTIQSVGTPVLSNFSSSAGNSYPYGTSTNLSITVSPAPANPAFSPNIVRFTDNGTTLGTVSVTAATGVATLSGVLLAGGTHSNIRVAFLGDANWQAINAGPFTVVVSPAAPNITFTGAPFSATYGGTLSTGTLTANGLGGTAAAPTGSITVSSGGAVLTTFATINPGGTVAPLTLTGLQLPASVGAGTNTIGYNYTGDGNYAPAANTALLVVNRAQPAVTFTLSANPLTAGQTETITATVKAPGLGTPGGSVSFLDGGTQLGTATVTAAGTATFGATSLTAGTHSISVSYAGDNNFLNASSAATSLTVSNGSLAFVTSTLPNGAALQPYSSSVTATGGTPPYTYGATGLPAGIAINASTGALTGTPQSAGTSSVTFTVTDSAKATATFTTNLVITAPPLSIPGGSSSQSAVVGTPLSVNYNCTGGVPPYTYQVTGNLPPGLSFANCILSGTPTTVGTYVIHITLFDSMEASVTRDITITVTAATFSLPGGALPDAEAGVAYKTTVTAIGGVPPITYSAGSLPDGLSMARNGDITGTPTAAGQYSIRVTATDSSVISAPATAAATYTLNIVAALALSASLPDGTLGTAYSGSISATGGIKPYVFTTTGLPGGLVLAADGTVTGTPNTPGTFTVNANVTDAVNGAARATYTIKIAAPALVISSNSAPNGTVGAAYSATFTATGGVAPYTFSASGQPSTLTMSAAGTLSGTPSAPATVTMAVTVRDSVGTTANKQFTFTIELPASPPLNFAGINTTVSASQQPRVSVALANTFPVDVQVTLSLSFQADSGPADPAVAFATGGATANITIPAGSLNGATDVGIQTGTVAGTITITAKLTASGTDVTPSPAPTRTARIAAAAPVIVSATAARNATGFTVTVVGYVTDREITSAAFSFNGTNLGTPSLNVTVDTLFAGWLGGNSPPSAPYGSQFTYTQPFTVNGSSAAITSVSVSLTNRVNPSNTVTVTVQ